MKNKKRGSERRRWKRLSIAIPVFVRGVDERGKEFLEFTSALNISAGGALVAVRRYLERSSEVWLEIPSAPMAHFEQTRRDFHAKVVRSTPLNRTHLWALKFTEPLGGAARRKSSLL